MTGIFDGMSTLLNGTFGAGVIYTPRASDVSQTVLATLRTAPIEVSGADGQPVLIEGPTLHVPRDILPDLKRGDRIAAVALPDTEYTVVRRVPSGSPAADAMIIALLEEVLT